MPRRPVLVPLLTSTICLCFVGAVNGQEPGPISLEASAGTNLTASGATVSGAVGFRAAPRLTFLVAFERFTAAAWTRGRAANLIALEGRVDLRRDQRVTPYALVGVGRGDLVGRTESTDEYARKEAAAVYAGGGVRFRLSRRLGAFVDARLGLKIGPYDIVEPMLPVRAGASLRF